MPHDIRSQVLSAIDAAIADVGSAPDQARYAEPLRQARAIIEAVPPYRPCRLCMDCVQSGASPAFCATWEQEIPSEWLEVGCDNWIDDIPF